MRLRKAAAGACLTMASSLIPSVGVEAAPATARSCRVEVVQPDNGPRRAEILRWLAGKASWSDPDEREIIRVFLADVDNDGATEVVVVRPAGNAGLRDIRVFRPAGSGFQAEATPPALFVGATEFLDPVSGQDQLLVRFCGKTYFTLRRRHPAGGLFSPARDTWIWERGGAHPVCNARWLAEQRRLFGVLFDRQSYDDAYWFLDGLQQTCGPAVGPALRGWMESGLARTALRMRAFGACLDHVAAARRTSGPAAGGSALRRELAASAVACTAGGERLAAIAGAPRYDLSWLLDLERDPQRQAALEPRFDDLLAAIAPDVRIPAEESTDDKTLRGYLKEFLWPPGITLFLGGRYVVLSGMVPHAAGPGAIWIDLETRRSLVGFVHVLASTTIDAAGIPPEAWDQTNNFGLGWGETIQYLEPDGSWREIVTPKRATAAAAHP